MLVVAGDNYLLLTQMQRWTWTHFLRNGEALRETKDRHNSLPDWSLVLNGDNRGQVSVQVNNTYIISYEYVFFKEAVTKHKYCVSNY